MVRFCVGRSPRAEVWPQLVDLTVGKSLELECRVTGRPKAKVTWFKDGVAIPREGRLRWKTTRLAWQQEIAVSVHDYHMVESSICRVGI